MISYILKCVGWIFFNYLWTVCVDFYLRFCKSITSLHFYILWYLKKKKNCKVLSSLIETQKWLTIYYACARDGEKKKWKIIIGLDEGAMMKIVLKKDSANWPEKNDHLKKNVWFFEKCNHLIIQDFVFSVHSPGWRGGEGRGGGFHNN